MAAVRIAPLGVVDPCSTVPPMAEVSLSRASSPVIDRRDSDDSLKTVCDQDAFGSMYKPGVERQIHTDEGYADAFWAVANEHLLPLKAPWLDFVPVRSQGTKLYDKDGRTVLDFTSGQMSSLLGHCHPEITATIQHTACKLDHLFSSMLSPPIVHLASALAKLLPPELSKFVFLSTGSETVECALKMAKMYTGGWEIVSFSTGYHGMSAGSSSATFVHGRVGYGPLVPGNFLLPIPDPLTSPFKRPDGSHDWQTEMRFGWDLIDRQSTGNLAACIVEPIVSTGGMIELPDGYLEALKAECEKRNMLLILDEAQTGMARTGDASLAYPADMFAYQRSAIIPDILLLSKTLGAGLPLAAVCTGPRISAGLKAKGFMYYTTHLNDPIVCAVGAKVCEIVRAQNMVETARNKGAVFKAGLQQLKESYPFITAVRGRGLMLGLHLASPEIGFALSSRCLELGLNCNLVPLKELGGTIRIVPPLTVTGDELSQGISILAAACEWVQKQGLRT